MPCPAGLRMMRRAQSSGGSTTVTTAEVQVVPFNPYRVSITFCNASSPIVIINKGAVGGSEPVGTAKDTAAPLTFTVDIHGNLPMGPFTANTLSSGAVLTWAETMLPPGADS